MSALTNVTIYVDHVATLVPDSGAVFSDVSYAVSIAEDALINTLIKNLTIINKPKDVSPISCEIIEGNEPGIMTRS